MSISSISSLSNLSSLYSTTSSHRTRQTSGNPEDGLANSIKKLMAKSDEDGDGLLSSTEATGLSSDTFTKVDTDGDGKLSTDEIGVYAKQQMDSIKDAFDSGDMDAARQKIESMLNGSDSEFLKSIMPQGPGGGQGGPGGPGSPGGPGGGMDNAIQSLLDSSDEDSNGTLNSTEATKAGLSSDTFSTIDTDGDGELSTDEIKTYTKTQMDSVKAAFESGGEEAGKSKIESLLSGSDGTFLKALMPQGPPPSNSEMSAYQNQSGLSSLLSSIGSENQLSSLFGSQFSSLNISA